MRGRKKTPLRLREDGVWCVVIELVVSLTEEIALVNSWKIMQRYYTLPCSID